MNRIMKKAVSHGLALVLIIGVVAVVGMFMMGKTSGTSTLTGLTVGPPLSSLCVDSDVDGGANGMGINLAVTGTAQFNGQGYTDFCVGGSNSNKKVASSKYVYEYFCYNTTVNPAIKSETKEPSKYGVKLGYRIKQCPNTGTCSEGKCSGCASEDLGNIKCEEKFNYGYLKTENAQEPVLLSKAVYELKEHINTDCTTAWVYDSGCGLVYGVTYLNGGYSKLNGYSSQVESTIWPYNYIITNYKVKDICQNKKGCIQHILADSYCNGNWQINISQSTLTGKTNTIRSDCSKGLKTCEVDTNGAACV